MRLLSSIKMMKELNISGYCTIRNNVVIANNTPFLSHSGTAGEMLNILYGKLGISYPKFHKMDMLSKLGLLSSEILLKNRDINKEYNSDEVGVILMNSSSSLDTDRKHQEAINNRSEYFPSPSVFVYTLPNVVIGEISIRNKINGEGCFFVAPAFDSALLYLYTKQLFDLNIVRCCITGWVETDGDNIESLFFLVEESSGTESGIVKFSPDILENIYIAK